MKKLIFFAVFALVHFTGVVSSDSDNDSKIYHDNITFSLEELKKSIDAGLNVNALIREEKMMTPLMLAVFYDSPDTVRYLLSKNADPNIKDDQGSKVLSYAITANNLEIIEMLLNTGLINVNEEYNYNNYSQGKSYYDFAFSEGSKEVQKLLKCYKFEYLEYLKQLTETTKRHLPNELSGIVGDYANISFSEFRKKIGCSS